MPARNDVRIAAPRAAGGLLGRLWRRWLGWRALRRLHVAAPPVPDSRNWQACDAGRLNRNTRGLHE